MTNPDTVPLRYGLTAIIITHAELARQKRTEARRQKSRAGDQHHDPITSDRQGEP